MPSLYPHIFSVSDFHKLVSNHFCRNQKALALKINLNSFPSLCNGKQPFQKHGTLSINTRKHSSELFALANNTIRLPPIGWVLLYYYSNFLRLLHFEQLLGFALPLVILVHLSSRWQILWRYHCCGGSKSHGCMHSTAQFALLRLRCPPPLLTPPHLEGTQKLLRFSHGGCLKLRHLLGLRCSL